METHVTIYGDQDSLLELEADLRDRAINAEVRHAMWSGPDTGGGYTYLLIIGSASIIAPAVMAHLKDRGRKLVVNPGDRERSEAVRRSLDAVERIMKTGTTIVLIPSNGNLLPRSINRFLLSVSTSSGT